MAHPDIHVETIVSQPYDENSYVVYRSGRQDCLVFDPGFEPNKIISYVTEHSLEPAAFAITHGHSDHIAGNQALKERWPDCPLVIGAGDAPKLSNPRLNLSAMLGIGLTSPKADRLLRDGDVFRAAGFEFDVYEIPGHSSGHVVFIAGSESPPVAFVGDVLFAGSVGRTDFPDGNFGTLVRGIHEKLFMLADNTLVYPGHGSGTTIGEEKRTNPFVGIPAGYSDRR